MKTENQPPPLPTLTTLLTPAAATGLFLTPPHSFPDIHSPLSSAFWGETIIFCSPMKGNLQRDITCFILLLDLLYLRDGTDACVCLCVYILRKLNSAMVLGLGFDLAAK